MNELMEIKQLPIISQQLQSIKLEIERKTSEAMKMVCTEDSRDAIKKIRTEFNKQFSEFETKRKQIKNAVQKPYLDFEEVYKKCITNPYKEADQDLKQKIEFVEGTLKAKREEEIKAYFDELKIAEGLTFLVFADANINTTLSASKKSLIDKCNEFINKVKTDMVLIGTMDNSEEILLEYKTSFNVSDAIMVVKNRHQAMDELKKAQAERQGKAEEMQEKEEEIQTVLSAPVEVEEYSMSFKVIGTMAELKSLKEFLKKGGYKYESI